VRQAQGALFLKSLPAGVGARFFLCNPLRNAAAHTKFCPRCASVFFRRLDGAAG
jgi:hypothetical protein